MELLGNVSHALHFRSIQTLLPLGQEGASGVQRSSNTFQSSFFVDLLQIAEIGGEPGRWLSNIAFLSAEVIAALYTPSYNLEWTHLQVTLFSTTLLENIPIHILRGYQNRDYSIRWGADLFGLKLPIQILQLGDVFSLTGHTGADVGMQNLIQQEASDFSWLVSVLVSFEGIVNLAGGRLQVGAGGLMRFDFTTSSRWNAYEFLAHVFFLLHLGPSLGGNIKISMGFEHNIHRTFRGLSPTNFVLKLRHSFW